MKRLRAWALGGIAGFAALALAAVPTAASFIDPATFKARVVVEPAEPGWCPAESTGIEFANSLAGPWSWCFDLGAFTAANHHYRFTVYARRSDGKAVAALQKKWHTPDGLISSVNKEWTSVAGPLNAQYGVVDLDFDWEFLRLPFPIEFTVNVGQDDYGEGAAHGVLHGVVSGNVATRGASYDLPAPEVVDDAPEAAAPPAVCTPDDDPATDEAPVDDDTTPVTGDDPANAPSEEGSDPLGEPTDADDEDGDLTDEPPASDRDPCQSDETDEIPRDGERGTQPDPADPSTDHERETAEADADADQGAADDDAAYKRDDAECTLQPENEEEGDPA